MFPKISMCFNFVLPLWEHYACLGKSFSRFFCTLVSVISQCMKFVAVNVIVSYPIFSWHYISMRRGVSLVLFFQYFLVYHSEQNWNLIFLHIWFWMRTYFLEALIYQSILRFLSKVHRHLLQSWVIRLSACMLLSLSFLAVIHNNFRPNGSRNTYPWTSLYLRSHHLQMHHLMFLLWLGGA